MPRTPSFPAPVRPIGKAYAHACAPGSDWLGCGVIGQAAGLVRNSDGDCETVRHVQKADVDGRLFGSVTNFDIADGLTKMGLGGQRSQCRSPELVKTPALSRCGKPAAPAFFASAGPELSLPHHKRSTDLPTGISPLTLAVPKR